MRNAQLKLFRHLHYGWACAVLLLALPAAAQIESAPVSLEFSQARYTSPENARFAAITIKRIGATNSAVAVRFSSLDDTAVSPEDYLATNEVVTLAPGVLEFKVRVALVDDLTAQSSRTVNLLLSEPAGGASLGAQAAAVLEILDNDAAQSAWVSFGLDRLPFLRRSLLEIPLWQYAASLLYIFLAFYLSKGADYVMRYRLKHWAAHTRSRLDDLLIELLRAPVKVVVFVILLHLGLRIFAWPTWFADFFSKALKIVVAVSITYMLLRVIDLLIGYWQKRRGGDEDRSFNEQLLPIIRNTFKVFVVVVASLLTLQNLGLNITSLIASLSIGGLALSLAAQDTLSNLFGAIAILTDKPCRVGDVIRVDSVEGKVEAIGLRSTRVRNLDGHVVSIPNKTMGNATITNVTQRPNIKTVMNFGLTYNTSSEQIQLATSILLEIFQAHPATDDILVAFNKFADSALNIQVVHWWKGTDYRAYLAGMQALNLTIKERFERSGLEFAYPSSTIYLRQETPAPTKPEGNGSARPAVT